MNLAERMLLAISARHPEGNFRWYISLGLRDKFQAVGPRYLDGQLWGGVDSDRFIVVTDQDLTYGIVGDTHQDRYWAMDSNHLQTFKQTVWGVA